MERREAVAIDAAWVLKRVGSEAQDKKEPGSRAKAQVTRIAEFVRQWDKASELLRENEIDLVTLTVER